MKAIVTDSKGEIPGGPGNPPVREFVCEDAVAKAEDFIGTLPEFETGRYGIDACVPKEGAHCDDCGCPTEEDVRLARSLSPTMRDHIDLGIAGATGGTLAALERRGLIEEAPEKPGYVRLSEAGEKMKRTIRAIKAGNAP